MPIELDELYELLPEADRERVLLQENCDIDASFMGFTHVYKALAALIPLHWSVFDFGCAYAAQAYYFRNHAAYWGIDPFEGERFSFPNTNHYVGTAGQFHRSGIVRIDPDTSFAICSYMPDFGSEGSAIVRVAFTNLFVYYPAGDGRSPFINGGKKVKHG